MRPHVPDYSIGRPEDMASSARTMQKWRMLLQQRAVNPLPEKGPFSQHATIKGLKQKKAPVSRLRSLKKVKHKKGARIRPPRTRTNMRLIFAHSTPKSAMFVSGWPGMERSLKTI